MLPDTYYLLIATCSLLLAACFLLFGICYMLLATCYWPLPTCSLLAVLEFVFRFYFFCGWVGVEFEVNANSAQLSWSWGWAWQNLNLLSLSDELKTIGEKQHLDRFIGNLRREKGVKVLPHFHYLVPDCDEVGNLKITQLFVQLVGVKFDEEVKQAVAEVLPSSCLVQVKLDLVM